MPCRRFAVVILTACLLGAIASPASAKDPYAELLKRHYPHGIFKLRTTASSIEWKSETLENGKVQRGTETFHSIDEFQTALVALKLHKNAYIQIAGIWDHDAAPDTDEKMNEAVLQVLRAKGYQEAGYANLKKYYGPDGHHFVDAIRADGTILWTSSTIRADRVVSTRLTVASLDEFKQAFTDANIGKAAAIEVHLRAVKDQAAYARAEAVLKFLQQQGYKKAGAVSD